MRRLSKDEFVAKAQKVHGYKYNYSDTIYTINRVKIQILCSEHGVFWQTPSGHLNGYGCPRCGGTGTYTTEQYIAAARKVHGDFYDYSRVIYNGSYKDIVIKCPIHFEFTQNASIHLQGHGCMDCGFDKTKIGLTYKLSDFLIEAKKTHGDRYVYSEVEYTLSTVPVKIGCKVHGDYWQRPAQHIQGAGCPTCGLEKIAEQSKATRLGQEVFLTRAISVHGNRYDYSNSFYTTSHTPVTIRCKVHGFFTQRAYVHLAGNNCPKCTESKGERTIAKVLDSLFINYIQEHSLPNNRYRYDFYLPDYNVFIEFHGRQHYEFVEYFHKTVDEFRERRYIDRIKAKLVKEFCGRLIVLNYRQLKEGVVGNVLTASLRRLTVIK